MSLVDWLRDELKQQLEQGVPFSRVVDKAAVAVAQTRGAELTHPELMAAATRVDDLHRPLNYRRLR